MHHVEIKRRMGEEDIAAISVLLEAASLADGHRALGEHQWLDLVQGGREGFAGFVARQADRGRVIGYAQVSRGNDGSWAVEYAIDPRFRELGADLRRDLSRAALDEIAAQGGGHVHLWVPKPDAIDDAVAEAVGLTRGRDLVQMRRRLPIEGEHSTVAVRAFRPGSDEPAWLEVNNRAFRGHPEQGSWDLATLRERERQPWFDPEGFLLCELDGRLAGFCWTKVHEPDADLHEDHHDHDHDHGGGHDHAHPHRHAPAEGGSDAGHEYLVEGTGELGEIYVIAVDPDFQGRRLGRELVLAGLESLAAKGVRTGMLYVDHDNESARRLYASLGFTDDHVDRAYVADVPAAPGQAPAPPP